MNTVNCLLVCRALEVHVLAGKVKLITTELFADMAPYFHKGTVTALDLSATNIAMVGQLCSVWLINLTNKIPLPPTVYFSSGVVM